MDAREKSLARDLEALAPIKGLVVEIAASYGLEPAAVAAVASRESGGGRLLGKAGNPPDTGDSGHGRGLMQADDRYWSGLLNLDGKGPEEDAWRWPAFNLAFGCWLLMKNLRAITARLPALSAETALRGALSAYNCGLGRVLTALEQGGDPDAFTTGADYAKDVMARAAWFKGHGY